MFSLTNLCTVDEKTFYICVDFVTVIHGYYFSSGDSVSWGTYYLQNYSKISCKRGNGISTIIKSAGFVVKFWGLVAGETPEDVICIIGNKPSTVL